MDKLSFLRFKSEQFLHGFRFLQRSFLDWKDLIMDECGGVPFEEDRYYELDVVFNYVCFFESLSPFHFY
ncbi:MAG: hypothetical protein R3321_03755 [Nitrososphaeraceae archaeon]|nr:hypothetical protein [Nitrososphaeraceae archaeon]